MDPIARMVAAGAAGAAGGGESGLYVDDLFSTFLYTGTSGTQSINNGIDLSGEGGLVWIKNRSTSNTYHALFDTERGTERYLYSNGTGAEYYYANNGVTSFNSNGFTVKGTSDWWGLSGEDICSWTFRKAPGFFDVVTYTGSGSAQNISHNLGSVPGMIIIKSTSNSENWQVWHRSVSGNLELDSTGIVDSSSIRVTAVSSTDFTLSTFNTSNANGQTYVAYIFAHDDQSFGTNSDEAIIKCGSYTGTGGTGLNVNLGFEPQFVFVKNPSNSSSNWIIFDMMRGMSDKHRVQIHPNVSDAEFSDTNTHGLFPTPTGFASDQSNSWFNKNGDQHIYMAIRRPHKPPTAGTDVFAVNTRNGNETAGTLSTAGFPVDLSIISARNVAHWTNVFDRLRGPLRFLATQVTNAEASYNNTLTGFDNNTAIEIGTDSTNLGVNRNSQTYIDFLFKRSPGFMDVVAYTGTGSLSGVNHNLGVTPELKIIKNRDNTYGDWIVGGSVIGENGYVYINSVAALVSFTNYWDGGDDSATQFSVRQGNGSSDTSGDDYIAYLFASLAGISKVGSYTGTGNTINIDCGFTSGARFVLIKRTDSAGDWYTFDTARGIVSGNDPYLRLNSTDAETTVRDYIDPLNAGFAVAADPGSPTNVLNQNGASYIFLAIA